MFYYERLVFRNSARWTKVVAKVKDVIQNKDGHWEFVDKENMENKTIFYNSEAITEAMDIGNLDATVELTISPDNKFISARIVSDISDMYEGNNAFRAEVDDIVAMRFGTNFLANGPENTWVSPVVDVSEIIKKK